MRPIDQILIRCTGTPDGEALTIAQFDERHRQFGHRRRTDTLWRCNADLRHVAVHHLVYVNGAIASGRHHDEPAAAARGVSAERIDVALVGTAAFTAAQWRSLRDLVEALARRYPGAAVTGHDGFPAHDWLDGGMNPLPEHLITEPRAEHAAGRARVTA